MDLVLRYLENAVRLRDLAAIETDPKVRADLEKQSEAYYKLAEKRARERDLPMPDKRSP
ncbi:MAG TPA: hypothetical protein VFL51_17415 [Pseudolabrys sp.]|nr:hypothetical protein [Pseudolabrys sp.]